MCLEIKDSTVVKSPENISGVFRTSQNEYSHIFREIGIQEIIMQLFENFKTKKHLKCYALASQKYLNGLQILLLGKMTLIALQPKDMQKLIKYKVHIISHAKHILTHSVRADLNHISIVCSHYLIGACDVSYVQYLVSYSKINNIKTEKFSIIYPTYSSSKFLLLLLTHI